METTVNQLSSLLGGDQRRLRRSLSQGVIRAERPSPRKLTLDEEELDYLKVHWQLIEQLRRTLRTEPNVRLAAIFGSVARGQERPDSDLDLLVAVRHYSHEGHWRLAEKVERISGRKVDIIYLDNPKDNPLFFNQVLADARLIIDRDGRWDYLMSQQEELSSLADGRVRDILSRDFVEERDR